VDSGLGALFMKFIEFIVDQQIANQQKKEYDCKTHTVEVGGYQAGFAFHRFP
jgi:hypothetical protein